METLGVSCNGSFDSKFFGALETSPEVFRVSLKMTRLFEILKESLLLLLLLLVSC